MIQKLLANSSPKQKKIIGVVFVVVIVALFYFLLVDPAMNNITKIDRDIAAQEKKIQEDLRILSEKSTIEADIAKYQIYISDNISDEGVIISNFLKTIDDLSKKSEIALINKLPPKQTETDQPYVVYQGDFEINGKFENVVKFIHSVETSQGLFKVVKFNLAGKKGEEADDVKAAMTIAKIIITAHPPVVKEAANSDDQAKASSK